MKIELPWIDGDKLRRRWYPLVFADDVDYEELHHCIFGLGLPVYNYLKKLQEGIVDEVELAMGDDGYPLAFDSWVPITILKWDQQITKAEPILTLPRT